jgi:pectin methylesterase-like acyl-CoA thioesterase
MISTYLTQRGKASYQHHATASSMFYQIKYQELTMSPQHSPRFVLTHSIARGALILALLLFNLALSPASHTHAANLTVCASGCNYTSISAAVAAAIAGDTISVTDAIHTEKYITIDRNLTIQGRGIDATIVQASDNPGLKGNWIFAINPGVTVTIRDM